MHYTAAFRTTVPPPEPELFDLFEEPGGGRPDLLLEPQGQQLGVPRHFVEHLADIAPKVQILDVPVPQMGVELADILKCVDLQLPIEQVIDVTKISQDSIQPRSVLRRPQTAEQLVEVPTIISYSSLLQRTDELIVDIPVPGRGGGWREVSKVLTLDRVQQPWLRSRSSIFLHVEVLKVFPQDRVRCSVLWSSSLTFLFQLVEVFTEFTLILGVQAHPQFYALLHMMSKVRVPPGVRVRGCTRTRAHGLWRLMRPRSVRTRTAVIIHTSFTVSQTTTTTTTTTTTLRSHFGSRIFKSLKWLRVLSQ